MKRDSSRSTHLELRHSQVVVHRSDNFGASELYVQSEVGRLDVKGDRPVPFPLLESFVADLLLADELDDTIGHWAVCFGARQCMLLRARMGTRCS